MPKRLIALNVFLGALGVVFALLLIRELAFPRRLPMPPEARALRTTSVAEPAKPALEDLSAYSVIVSRHLFNASRDDRALAGGSSILSGGRPFLYGVVVDGADSRAYLQDPATQRVRGYRIGDAVAGWTVEKIAEDRVIVMGPGQGRIELPLRDPAKPQGSAATPAPAPVLIQGAPPPPALSPGPSRFGVPSPPAGPLPPSIQGSGAEAPAGLPAGIPPQLVRPGGKEGR